MIGEQPFMEEEIVALYGSGLSTYKVASRLGVPRSQVCKAVAAGGSGRTLAESKRKYVLVDEGVLDSIDSEEKAYFLGLLCSDGWNDRRCHQVCIALSARDAEVLERLSLLFYDSRPLRSIEARDERRSPQKRLVVVSRRISDVVSTYGVTAAKTHTISYPDCVPDRLARHFVRGVFDGDGCISLGERRDPGRPARSTATFSIVGNRPLIEGIQGVMRDQCGVEPRKVRVKHPGTGADNIVYFANSSEADVLAIRDWLYDGATVFLERKRSKFQEAFAR